ncbi:S66 peptidase family protein [Pedobacter gandavensis]|uniref:LD-carboxypeptidase n=1 Tax=Pedobacter gandavensis TaxID=2679963 RepID=A0ABR6F060_9SPHI|nr:LD-carboxypeptidase [Pedobacter gandavensis]MBB2150088.1 LD-carboxypeptidase [Pedobacter gandavensis]
MIKQPPYLKKGDKIGIASPAKKLTADLNKAIAVLEHWGLEVVLGEHVYAAHDQFAGTDEQRREDLQNFLDDPEIKAIFASRGGYGTIRILDGLDFTKFQEQPKWVIGFSDITILLSHILAQTNTQSIHGQMPKTFETGTTESLESLRKSLFGEPQIYTYESDFENREGSAEGILIGGNLTLLIAAEGSDSAFEYSEKILFIEDVGEHEYAIDRMMRTLKRSGKLEKLKGLIVGAFNGYEVENLPFGQSPEQIIQEIVKDYDYPVCYNFPLGHIDDNRAMLIGKSVQLFIQKHLVKFKL